MNESKILEKLIQTGKLSADAFAKLKIESSQTGKSIESLLMENGTVTELDLVRIKAEIFNIPFIDLSEVVVDEKTLDLLPYETMQKYKMVVFETEGMMAKLAMSDPFDVQAINYAKEKLNQFKRFDIYIAPRDQVLALLDRNRASTIGEEIEESLEEVEMETTEIEDTGATEADEANLAHAPVAKIVSTIIEFAAKLNASDIHIEPLENRTRVRYRVHGILVEKLSLPKSIHPSLIARIKIMTKTMKIDVKRAPQDGRIPMKYRDKSFDLRVSTLPAIYGEKVVMRLLEKGGKVPHLEESGLRGPGYKTYTEALHVTVGVILITGPTGSGKTQTLASSMFLINNDKVNIITLEDPVEIRIEGVNQVQINPQAGLTFASGLRSILRQDPNIIMVGEIRDVETAQLAVQAALTGHLVLATLHTNSAAAALPRLVDMGIENYLLASTLKAVVAQRLVRTVCKNCITAYPMLPEVAEEINHVLASIDGFNVQEYLTIRAKQGNVPPYFKPPEVTNGVITPYLYKGKGCDKCNNQGYSGRTGIFEVLPMTESIGRLLMKNKTTSEIETEACKNGMITMLQDGYLKALEGHTTIEEVQRVITT